MPPGVRTWTTRAGGTSRLEDDGLVVAFMGGTNVELRFSPDAVVDVDGREHTVSRVSFLADDPRAATTLMRTHVRSLRARTAGLRDLVRRSGVPAEDSSHL